MLYWRRLETRDWDHMFLELIRSWYQKWVESSSCTLQWKQYNHSRKQWFVISLHVFFYWFYLSNGHSVKEKGNCVQCPNRPFTTFWEIFRFFLFFESWMRRLMPRSKPILSSHSQGKKAKMILSGISHIERTFSGHGAGLKSLFASDWCAEVRSVLW